MLINNNPNILQENSATSGKWEGERKLSNKVTTIPGLRRSLPPTGAKAFGGGLGGVGLTREAHLQHASTAKGRPAYAKPLRQAWNR